MNQRVFISLIAIAWCMASLACNSGGSAEQQPEQPPVEQAQEELTEESDDPRETAEEVAEPEKEQTKSAETWRFETEFGADMTYEFRAYRDDELVVHRLAHEEGGTKDIPEVGEHFETEFCDSPAVVATLAHNVSTGVSAGTLYNYVVIDREAGEVLGVLTAAETYERHDGSPISETREQTEELLRAGTDDEEYCAERPGTSFWAD